MSAHIRDELPRLLTGEASRDMVADGAAHLRGCPECQQELVSAVVAHASLLSAQRFAPDLVAGRETARQQQQPAAAPPPDPNALFAQVRREAAAGRTRRTRAVAGVAAAAVLVGGGVTAAVIATSSGGPPARTVALSGPRHHVATATLIGTDHMRIDATSLPELGPGKQYEVWLTNRSGTALQAVGFIPSDRRADLSVPAPLMGAYQDIAVSVQRLRQTRFSGKVVASGSYE